MLLHPAREGSEVNAFPQTRTANLFCHGMRNRDHAGEFFC
jgi:hypothetical protein